MHVFFNILLIICDLIIFVCTTLPPVNTITEGVRGVLLEGGFRDGNDLMVSETTRGNDLG